MLSQFLTFEPPSRRADRRQFLRTAGLRAMPFQYLRKLRADEERQRRSAISRGQTPPLRAGGAGRAIRLGLLAILLAPIALNLPWLHSAFGPGLSLPDVWIRPAPNASTAPECWTVQGGEEFKFCEDVHLIPGTKVKTVLVSCDAGRAGWNTVMGPLARPEPRGRLFTYEYPTGPDGKKKKAHPVELVGFPKTSEFHPLGVSILNNEEKENKLFVINHQKHLSAVEVFNLSTSASGWQARWERSITHPLATHTPNSIHALTPTSFVVTNDHLFARRPGPLQSHLVPLLRQLLPDWLAKYAALAVANRKAASLLAQTETLLGLPLGWVSHVEFGRQDVEVKVLARNIPFANGLAITQNAETMVVAATTFPGIYIYELDLPHRHARLKTKLHLPFRVDNLAFSPSYHSLNSRDIFGGQTLLATGHPAPLELIRMARNPTTRTSPSWSVAITRDTATKSEEGENWEDSDAHLPAHHFVLSHNTEWRIRTLLQSRGEKVRIGNNEIQVASSASSFYHPYHDTEKGGGTLLVSGLYGDVTACTNVGT